MSCKWLPRFILTLQLLYLTTSPNSAANTTLFMPGGKYSTGNLTKITQPLKSGIARSPKSREHLRCSGNKMQFDFDVGFSCKYDDLCYQVFQDCCPDFVKQCGNQTFTVDAGMKSRWKCIELPEESGRSSTARGLWMITTCADNWPDDRVRKRCESAWNFTLFNKVDWVQPANSKQERFTERCLDKGLPVVSKLQRFTYRNKFCAICNHEKTFTSYQIKAETEITPPESFDLAQKLDFIRSEGGKVFLKISSNQERRYCLKYYKEKCENTSHPLYKACLRGPVEIISRDQKQYYKNKYCAKCNKDIVTGSPGYPGLPTGFNLVFTPGRGVENKHKTYIERTPNCGPYNKDLQICGIIPTTTTENFSNKFLVLITYRTPFSNSKHHICASMIEESFGLKSGQISDFSSHSQGTKNVRMVKLYYMVASFYLTLTPFQEILLANHNNISAYVESKKFLKFFHFSETFPIYLFTILKIQTKRLGCYQGKKLQHSEYTMHNKSTVLYDKSTRNSYSLQDYFVLNDTFYIVLCSKLILSDCFNGTYVKLFPGELVILPDLSLYHNRTNTTYPFGDYQITESLNESSPYAFNFPSNKTQRNNEGYIPDTCERKAQSPREGKREKVEVSICIPTQRKRVIVLIQSDQSSQNFMLQLLTLIGFSVSSVFLLAVLITHGLFSELRTLPGLNLMSLCLSMLLSNTVWLVNVPSFQGKITCLVFAVFSHYLLLVTFHAMTVISFHSSLVFSYSFVVPRKDKRMKTFFKYSLFIWLQPAIFITICLVLDNFSIFTMNYGVGCWLGTKNAIFFMFLLPVVLLFTFNIACFIRMAVHLLRQDNDSEILMKKRRQNLIVCVKLASLVSFPWAFAFLGRIFPNFEAFQYLFVLFTCFQGCYIGVAFLCTGKILVLFRKKFTLRIQSAETRAKIV